MSNAPNCTSWVKQERNHGGGRLTMCREAKTPSTMAQQKAATTPKLMKTIDATSCRGKTTAPGLQARQQWPLSASRHPSRHLRLCFIHPFSACLSVYEGCGRHAAKTMVRLGSSGVSGWHGARLFTSSTTFLSSLPSSVLSSTQQRHPPTLSCLSPCSVIEA